MFRIYLSKALILSSIALSNMAWAAVSTELEINNGSGSTYCKMGLYAGLQAGWDNTYYKKLDVLAGPINNNAGYNSLSPFTAHINNTGNAGRVFAGYQFTPYFASELGYFQFHTTSFNGIARNNNGQVAYVYTGNVNQYAIDLSSKLTLPFEYGFGGYIKVGAASIFAHRYANFSLPNNIQPGVIKGTSNVNIYQSVRAVYGAGLDYTIPDTSFDIDISYTEIAGGGGIPKNSLAALGVNYKFA